MSSSHKYIRREWRNGRWVYYYEEEKDPGRNYKTQKQLEEEKAAEAAAKAEQEARDKAKADREKKIVSDIESAIEKGKQAMEHFVRILQTPIRDIPKAIKYYTRDDE